MSGPAGSTDSATAELPVDRARIAVAERAAQPARHVPLPPGHVWTAVDDASRDDPAVPWILECHARPARERPMGDADQPSRHGDAAGGAFAVEPGAVPGD